MFRPLGDKVGREVVATRGPRQRGRPRYGYCPYGLPRVSFRTPSDSHFPARGDRWSKRGVIVGYSVIVEESLLSLTPRRGLDVGVIARPAQRRRPEAANQVKIKFLVVPNFLEPDTVPRVDHRPPSIAQAPWRSRPVPRVPRVQSQLRGDEVGRLTSAEPIYCANRKSDGPLAPPQPLAGRRVRDRVSGTLAEVRSRRWVRPWRSWGGP